MAKSKLLVTRRAALVLIVTALSIASLLWFGAYPGKGRQNLPVGNRTPMISLGERHGLILASDGSLWTWGADFLGWPVLGLGQTTGRATTLRRIGNETSWVSFSAGAERSVALKSDGTLWTWGESLRAGSTPPISLARPIQAASGNDWKQAAAGGVHILAVKTNGTLWAWGINWAGSLGTGSANDSALPVQVGSGTNWVKVWASTLESVGMEAEGSLWYWGDNPDPTMDQKIGAIRAPMRISPGTNWVDVGFGVNTVLAIKSDGTLWAFGRNAHVYTAANESQNSIPTQVGTNSDWRSISTTPGWWCHGLIKKDGSFWFMDASDGKPNGPRPPYKPVSFRRIEFDKGYAAFAAGAVHAAPPGVHGAIGVILTREGEVWTWGMVLGDPPSFRGFVQDALGSFGRAVGLKTGPYDPPPKFREKPWRLGVD